MAAAKAATVDSSSKKKKKKSGGGGSKAFAVAQQIGKSLFLPIAILPFAGLLLGVGSSFTNATTIATYHLEGVLYEGSFLYGLMQLFNAAGSAIFDNLALIFALAVALGMAKKEKGVAVVSSAIFYLVMNMTINMCLQISGQVDADGNIAESVKDGAISTVLGIPTLSMGVFGGIIAGLITAALCNRFYKQQLPSALSFFAGTRFVPIISMVVAILTGFILYFVWPVIQSGIFALGNLVQASGYFGTFIYGCIERALIPFGLHHIFYMPFWQTGVGGSMEINGELVEGAQNIFFAQLADPNCTHFSIDACRFLAGKYPFMMGGLPGAALAMYTCAKPEKKKQAGSLLFSVALTSFITGVTEPIEFTFLFLAPSLFGIHVVFAGLSFMLCHIFEVCIGTTFSDGLIDFILYGVLPGQSKSNWMACVPLILIYFVLYFVVFRFFILKKDLKTPGREDDDEEMKMMTKADYQAATGVGVAGGKKAAKNGQKIDEKSAMILRGIGGSDNVTEIDNCATRLRLTLVDGTKVDEKILKASGASGVVVKGNAIQVIYGPQVSIIKSNFEEFVDDVRAGNIDESAIMGTAEEAPAAAPAPAEPAKPKMKDSVIGAHMNGRMLLMNEVEDDAFASCAMGDGVAIEPSEGKLFAPADGEISMVFPTKHAVGMTTTDGTELLLHIGIDTVKLDGKYFEAHVEDGQQVKKGDLLVSFDMDAIKAAGYKLTTPMIVTNTDDYSQVRPLATGDVKAGQDFMEVRG
ncbi:MAG: glucose PTS transporter subunit IIA [Eubacteriales bacterium]|jgi:PTS system D-glucosamine-specific IIC component